MTCRYNGELIRTIREETSTEGASDNYGIEDRQLLQWLNDAQNRLQSKIGKLYPSVFWDQTTFSPVASQEAYTLKTEIYTGAGSLDVTQRFSTNRVAKVEYSHTGNARDYRPLQLGTLLDRTGVSTNFPVYYILFKNQILISPIPNMSTGTFRVVYEKKLPSLSLRRGKMNGDATNTGNFYDYVTLQDWTIQDEEFTIDSEALGLAEFVTVVNFQGDVIRPMLKLEATSSTKPYDSSTLRLYFAAAPNNIRHGLTTVFNSINLSSYTSDDEGYDENGFFVTDGIYATTHSQLPDFCERYLIAYANWKTQKRDGSNDEENSEQEVSAIENDIIENFAQNSLDVIPAPYTEDID